jgi:signal transduction histidine kinase
LECAARNAKDFRCRRGPRACDTAETGENAPAVSFRADVSTLGLEQLRAMQHPKLDVLKSRPLPDLAVALRAARPLILDTWRKKVVEVLPAADELTLRQFENNIPTLLDSIADALASDGPKETEELIRKAPSHGETRFHQQFNLNELLIEYHLLRGTVFEYCTTALGRPLELHEIVELNSGIDVALRAATIAFTEHQAEQITSEAETFTKYLAFLSHDIRGSLNGVLLTAEVLKRDLANEPKFAESVEDLDTMRRSIHETVATIDRFLNAERLRRGKMPVNLGPVNLTSMLHDITRQYQHRAADKGLGLAVAGEEDCVATSDRDVLTVIVQNLLANAIKYSTSGTVKLTCSVNSDGAAQITVADEGPGIAPDRLAALFSPFTRGETHGQSGTGLGLWIARHASDLLGAQLRAQSTPGAGATFILELPIPS